MKKTMKYILLGAALAGTMLAAGCGDSSTAKSGAASGQSQSKLMQTIKQRGKLIVGTSSGYPPYVFVDAESPDKKVIGLDLEMCKQIADKLGVPMEVQDMSFSALLSSVTAGKVDIASRRRFSYAGKRKGHGIFRPLSSHGAETSGTEGRPA